MPTSLHTRGGLLLWREELESSSRREGPPRPTRGYSLSRRFGTREIATWTEGLFCEVEADLSSKLERLRIPGLSGMIYYALSPQRLSLLPYRDFFCRCCALRGDGEPFSIISFLVKETVLRPPSVSVLRPTFFFRKLITPSWISRYPVGKSSSRTPMSEYC